MTTTEDSPSLETVGRTLLAAASSLGAIVARLEATLSPVSFLNDMPDSRPPSAASVVVTVEPPSTAAAPPSQPEKRTASHASAVRAASSLVIDGILATGVRNAEVAATMNELRAIAVQLQSVGAAAFRAIEQQQLLLSEQQRPQRLLSILGDAPNAAAGGSLIGGGPDARYASAMNSMSHIQPLGATMGGSRTPHRGEAFRDVGDTDVQQWLNENYSHQAKREANGFELTLSRRVESFSVPGGESQDAEDMSDTEVTIEPLSDGSLQAADEGGSLPACPSTDATELIPGTVSSATEAVNLTSFLVPVANAGDAGAAVGDSVPPATGDNEGTAPTAASDLHPERGSSKRHSVVAATAAVLPPTIASNASRRLSTNVISPSAAAALKRQGSTALEASVRMTYSRNEKRSFPATTSARRLVEMLEVWNIPVIESINTTEFDVFAAHELYGTNLLLYVAANIFLQYNFVRSLQLDVKKMLTFFETVRYFYRDENPYHNSIHAADVLQTTHVYLCVNDVKENFSDVELLAVLFAALVHDVGHLGIANAFLCKIRHPFARIFNDASPLENTHASVAFSLLERPECNFFESSHTFTRPLYEDFRTLVIEGLIGTDMRHHHDQTKSVEGILADGQIDDNEVGKLLKAILHAADLSNPMKPFPIYMKWVDRVMAEFWQQGDEERRRGLPISILCDRNSTKVAKSQIGFISFVVKPFVRELAPVLPSVWLERLDLNAKALESVDPEEEQLRVRNITELAAQPWRDVDPATHASALLVIRNEISTMCSDEKVLQPAEFSSALDLDGNLNAAAAISGADDGCEEESSSPLLYPGALQDGSDAGAVPSDGVTQVPTAGHEDAAARLRGSVSSEESIAAASGTRERRSIVKVLDDGPLVADGDGGSSATASPFVASHPHRAANRFGSRANLTHRVPSSPSLNGHVAAPGGGGGDAELQMQVIALVQEVTAGYHSALQELAKSRGVTDFAAAVLAAWMTTLVTVERKRNDMRLQEQNRRRRGERRRRVSSGSSSGSPLSLFCAVMQHDADDVDGDPCALLGPDARSLLLSAYQAAPSPSEGCTPSAASRVTSYADMLQAPDCVSRICSHVAKNVPLLRSILSTVAAYTSATTATSAISGLYGSASTSTTTTSGADPVPVARTTSSVSSRKRLFSLHSEPVGVPKRTSSSTATAASDNPSTDPDANTPRDNAKAMAATQPQLGDDAPLTLTLLAATMTASLLAAVDTAVSEESATAVDGTNAATVTTTTPSAGEHPALPPLRQGAPRASPQLPATTAAFVAAPSAGASTPPAKSVARTDGGPRSTSHLASYTITAAGAAETTSSLFSRVVRLPLLDRSGESDPGGLPLGDTGASMTWNGRVGDVSAYRAKHRTLEAIPAPAWMREFLPSIQSARGGQRNAE